MATQGPEELDPQVSLVANWRGKRLPVQVSASSTVGHLKESLWSLTGVRPDRMKLLGLVRGKLPSDSTPVRSLVDVARDVEHSFLLVGTVDAEHLTPPRPEELPDVFDDLDLDYRATPVEALQVATDPQHRRKLRDVIRDTSIYVMHAPRPGRKMLVLDLDFTLFDCKSAAPMHQLARPGLHDLLTAVYPYFDLCLWSQTAWRYLEAKATELGMLQHADYRVAFVLDKTAMFQVRNEARAALGKPLRHSVKPLELIWLKFPGVYDARNTVHVDDLRRNFAMNPRNGLCVEPYRHAPQAHATDRELYLLRDYLVRIGRLPDLRDIDHSKWREPVADA